MLQAYLKKQKQIQCQCENLQDKPDILEIQVGQLIFNQVKNFSQFTDKRTVSLQTSRIKMFQINLLEQSNLQFNSQHIQKIMQRFMQIFENWKICSRRSAYEHFRQYWTKALFIANRLEGQIEVHFKKDLCTSPELYFMKIKNILNCYELLIVQFNEYCEVLEIQDLGKCMLKIFIQVNSIVESIFLNCALFKNKENKDKSNLKIDSGEKQQFRYKNIDRDGYTTRKISEYSYFVQKQRSKCVAKKIEEQLSKVQKIYQDDVHFMDDLKILETRKKAINLQPSKAELVIKEALLQIQTKQSSLLDIMELRNQRIQIDETKNLKKGAQLIFDQMKNAKNQKSINAVEKLMKIVEKYFLDKEVQRRQKLLNIETQTDFKQTPPPSNEKAQKEKVKKVLELKDIQIKDLKQEIKLNKLNNQSLEIVLKKKIESFEKQLLRERTKMKKLQQRISITTKLQKSQREQDFVISEQTVNKSEKSQINLQNTSTYSKNSLLDKQFQFSLKKRNLSRRSNLSKARPSSYNELKLSFNQSRQPRRSEFFQDKSIMAASNFSSDKIFEKKSQQHKEVEKILEVLSKIQSEKQDKKQEKKQQKQQQPKKIWLETATQTQLRQFKQKQPKEKQKVVKFKTEFKITEQYSWYIEYLIKSKPKSLKQNQIVFTEDSSSLLRKKRFTVNWPQQKFTRTFVKINQQEEYQNKENLKNSEKDIKQLFIGAQLDNCFSLNKKVRKFDKDINQKYEQKMQIPTLPSLNFTQQDIDCLFLKAQKAIDYEFLNNNIKSHHNRNGSPEILKSQRSCWLVKNSAGKNSKNRAQSCHLQAQISATKANDERVIQSLNRHLKMIKICCREMYAKVRNFFRYPHSAIYNSGDQKWKEVGRNQQQISLNEVRKIVSRLSKIHRNCKKKPGLGICEHLQKFMRKLGLSFVPMVNK